MRGLLVYVFICFFFFLPEKRYAYSNEFTILFSGEELGNLEPCGCYEGQLGGIAKRYSVVDFFRKQKNPVFPVSLGDLPKGCGRQDEIKMEMLCRAIGFMGYVLHNLGEKDIEINPQILSFLSQTHSIDFLSTNVNVDAPFPIKIKQSVIKECTVLASPVKIAFLGILSMSFLGSNVGEYITVTEPITALKPFVTQLRNKVDLIVLLSHAPPEESREIAQHFPEIGLIITGHTIEEPRDSITYVRNTAIISPGTGGKHIGIAKYVIHNKTIERKSVEVIPLDHSYKDSHEMISLLREYQNILAEEDLLTKIPQAPLPDGLSYTGSLTCRVCHKIIYDHWYKTIHAMSYDTLVGDGHQYDPECIQCHTTGYGDVSGFLNLESSQNLINVGCESCHGAGSKHIININERYGSTDERTCDICHDSEHSPKFQYKEYWERITHPKESLKKIPENSKSK